MQFASFEKAKEVEEFFASHAMPSMARTIKQSLERIDINAKWFQCVQNENSDNSLTEVVQKFVDGK